MWGDPLPVNPLARLAFYFSDPNPPPCTNRAERPRACWDPSRSTRDCATAPRADASPPSWQPNAQNGQDGSSVAKRLLQRSCVERRETFPADDEARLVCSVWAHVLQVQ